MCLQRKFLYHFVAFSGIEVVKPPTTSLSSKIDFLFIKYISTSSMALSTCYVILVTWLYLQYPQLDWKCLDVGTISVDILKGRQINTE